MKRTAVITLALAALAGTALAGGAGAVEVRAVASTVPLEGCGLTRLYAPVGEAGVAPAEDLGDAYVLQVFHETDGDRLGEAHVIIDCAVAEAWSFAPAGPALMTPDALEAAQTDSAYEQLLRFVRKSPRGHASVAGWRRADELVLVDHGSILNRRIELGTRGETYDLTCGCKLFNPASLGAR